MMWNLLRKKNQTYPRESIYSINNNIHEEKKSGKRQFLKGMTEVSRAENLSSKFNPQEDRNQVESKIQYDGKSSFVKKAPLSKGKLLIQLRTINPRKRRVGKPSRRLAWESCHLSGWDWQIPSEKRCGKMKEISKEVYCIYNKETFSGPITTSRRGFYGWKIKNKVFPRVESGKMRK